MGTISGRITVTANALRNLVVSVQFRGHKRFLEELEDGVWLEHLVSNSVGPFPALSGQAKAESHRRCQFNKVAASLGTPASSHCDVFRQS